MQKWILAVLILFSSVVQGRPYRFYLDPGRAEQVLASINFRPRLANDEWLKLINFDRDKTTQVKTGDNLWNIARSRFGNPFLWRKLWEENPWLTNPHELEVGRILAFYREEKSEGRAPRKIPVIKLRPDKNGVVSDVDNDIYVNRVFKARYRLNYLVVKADDLVGEVTGSYSPRIQLSVNDELYASFFEGKTVSPGSRFSVVREEKELRDKTQIGEPLIGTLVKLVGEVQVLSTESDLTRIEILSLYHPIQRGDKVMISPKVSGQTDAAFPPRDLIPQVVMLDDTVKTLGRQGELVTLNKGASQGMREGFLFKVFEDTDPVSDKHSGVIPGSKGEVRIVYVGDESSVGVINRNTAPIRVGDSLLSFPELPDRLVPPKKVRQEISID